MCVCAAILLNAFVKMANTYPNLKAKCVPCL